MEILDIQSQLEYPVIHFVKDNEVVKTGQANCEQAPGHELGWKMPCSLLGQLKMDSW
jgi:hypothetical protein